MPPRDTSAGHANVCGIAQIVLFLSRTGLDFPTSTQGFSLRRRGPPLFWNAVSRWKSPELPQSQLHPFNASDNAVRVIRAAAPLLACVLIGSAADLTLNPNESTSIGACMETTKHGRSSISAATGHPNRKSAARRRRHASSIGSDSTPPQGRGIGTIPTNGRRDGFE